MVVTPSGKGGPYMQSPTKCSICGYHHCRGITNCNECTANEPHKVLKCRISREEPFHDAMDDNELCLCDIISQFKLPVDLRSIRARIAELESENLQLHKQLDDWRKNGYKTSRIKY